MDDAVRTGGDVGGRFTDVVLVADGAVTTAGFGDVLEIGRQDRPAQYDLDAERATPEGVERPVAEALAAFREYERTATTAADAAVTPVIRDYLDRLTRRAERSGLPAPRVMQSNGGTAHAEDDPGAAWDDGSEVDR